MDEEITGIDDQDRLPLGGGLPDGGEDEGIQAEEHVVGMNFRKIHRIGDQGNAEEGNGGQQQVIPPLGLFVGMIARDQHDEGAEQHTAVIEKGVEAGKGEAGIVAQNVGRVNEIDGGAQKSQGASIAAGGVAHLSLAQMAKGMAYMKMLQG